MKIKMSILKRKKENFWQFFCNILTFKWHFSGGSGSNLGFGYIDQVVHRSMSQTEGSLWKVKIVFMCRTQTQDLCHWHREDSGKWRWSSCAGLSDSRSMSLTQGRLWDRKDDGLHVEDFHINTSKYIVCFKKKVDTLFCQFCELYRFLYVSFITVLPQGCSIE